MGIYILHGSCVGVKIDLLELGTVFNVSLMPSALKGPGGAAGSFCPFALFWRGWRASEEHGEQDVGSRPLVCVLLERKCE